MNNDYRSCTVAKTAEMLDCSEPTVYMLLRSGELDGFLLGRGSRRVIVASIEAFIVRQQKREAAGLIAPKATPTTREAIAV
jgi:excisionase family DNA binding protein